MSETTIRHAPLTEGCSVERQYEGSDIVHVCRLDHLDADDHACTCGLVWHHDTRRDEVEELRAELARLRALAALERGMAAAETPRTPPRAERTDR